MEISKACPVALLLQLQQLSHNLSGLNELIFRPFEHCLNTSEWISDVFAAALYSLYRTSISEITECNIVGCV